MLPINPRGFHDLGSCLEGSPKKSVPGIKLARCTVVGGGVNELRAELFSERLGIQATHCQDAAEHTVKASGDHEGGLHVIAAGSQGSLRNLVTAASGTETKPPAPPKTTFIMNWNRPLTQMRTIGGEAETLLNLSMKAGKGFAPEGLLGWGFCQVSDPFDGNGDPVRMLTHLTRALRHLTIRENQVELAKAAMACVAQGKNARAIHVATDGAGVMVEVAFEGPGDDGARDLKEMALRMAGWLDQMMTVQVMTRGPQDPLMAWVRKTRENQVSVGLMMATSHIPVVLVVDEIGQRPDQSIEPGAQTSYNVA
jgi:hypothetical protein